MPANPLPQQLCVLARALARLGFGDPTGRVTVRDGDSYLATPGAAEWSGLTANSIRRFSPDGKSSEGSLAPPGIAHQLDMHASADATVLIHEHPFWTTCWAAVGASPPAYDHVSARLPSELEVIDDWVGAPASSRGVGTLPPGVVYLVRSHGALITAEDIAEAYFHASALEWRARLAWQLRETAARPIADQKARSIRAGFNSLMREHALFEAVVRAEVAMDPQLLAT